MQELFSSATNGLMVAKPFLAAIVIIAALALVGDRGSKLSLNRNSPCLATICIFVFALGTGLTSWFLMLKPLFTLFDATFALSYSLILMYWSFWLLVAVLVSTKKLLYDEHQRRSGKTPF